MSVEERKVFAPSASRRRRGGARGLIALFAAGAAVSAFGYYCACAPGASSHEERQKAYELAMAEASKDPNWPADPKELVRDFWQAASRKDIPRMLLLVPGSTPGDYRAYEKWTPSEAKKIGDPEPPPSVVYYPVQVDFPGYPNKTIKMAVTRAADGRYVIDGQKTAWW